MYSDESARRIGAFRLGLGVAQGAALWLAWKAARIDWAPVHPAEWSIFLILALYLPLIPLAGAGRMRSAVLAAWTATAAMLLALLAGYDAWRTSPDVIAHPPHIHGPSIALIVFGGVALYVLHHLIEPADEARTLRPPYAAYVDGAWRHAFQLALSLAFVSVVWGVLTLGAALFLLIGVKPVAQALHSGNLAFPLLGLAFAAAVHQTDVRPGMIEGVRGVGLTLLSWLLVLAAPLVAAFLIALVITGVKPAVVTFLSAPLMFAAALLIVLVNATYQDGRDRDGVPAVMRWAARVGAVLITPLVALMAWGLLLRVGQHGLSLNRVAGLGVCLAASVYACGYLRAAVAPGCWMKPLETVNIVAAVTVVAIVLLMLSPVADPARLATDDQLQRLRSGRTPVAQFDFAALRFKAARYGRAALAMLERSPDPAVAAPARAVRTQTFYGDIGPPAGAGPSRAFARAQVRPQGALLPEGFRATDWSGSFLNTSAAACLVSNAACDLYVIDLDGDGRPEVLAASETGDGPATVLRRGADGKWGRVGIFSGAEDQQVRDGFRTGHLRPVPPEIPDLEVGGKRLRFRAEGYP